MHNRLSLAWRMHLICSSQKNGHVMLSFQSVLGWSSSSFLVILSPNGDTRCPSSSRQLICPAFFSHIADYVYDFYPISNSDVGHSVLVCDVEHTSPLLYVSTILLLYVPSSLAPPFMNILNIHPLRLITRPTVAPQFMNTHIHTEMKGYSY